MTTIVKEIESRTRLIAVDPDYESRICDTAIEALEDIAECDGASVLVKWSAFGIQDIAIPVLYIFFRDGITSDLECPRMHLSVAGKLLPCHAMTLAAVPSMRLLANDEAKRWIRSETERFMLRYGIRQTRLKENSHHV